MMKIGKKQFYLVLEIRSSVLKKASLTYLLGRHLYGDMRRTNGDIIWSSGKKGKLEI